MAKQTKRSKALVFLTDNIWPEITALCRRGRGHVAVAYLGKDGSDLLPLREGSVLVVNASLKTVRQGQTDPSELIKFLKDGVDVHTAQDLHAKVFVFPRRAVIGSANVSQSSAGYWQEAAISSSDPAIIREARAFVRSIAGQRLTLAELRALTKEFRSPKGEPSPGLAPRARKAEPDRTPLWVTKITRGKWDDEATALANRLRPTAEARLDDGDELDNFAWSGREGARFQQGHQVVEIVEEGGRSFVYPPATILVPPARTAKARGAETIVFTSRPEDQHPMSLNKARKNLGSYRDVLERKSSMSKVRDRAAAQALRQLWSAR